MRLLIVGFLLVAPVSHAEDVDLTQFSLEELLEMEVTRISGLTKHTHSAGEWMASYQFTHASMKGNRNNTHSVSTSEVLGRFPVAPLSMDMQMHMFMLMYAPTDEITLMAMVPYLEKSMDHVTRTGVRFTTDSEGVGDFSMSATYSLLNAMEVHRVFVGVEVLFPTGSIDRRDDTPSGTNRKLPYPMQLGSGSYDLAPSMMYSGSQEKWAWGSRIEGLIRTGKNSNSYRLGNRLELDAHVTRGLASWLSASLHLTGDFWKDIRGADPVLNATMVPTADPDLRAGRRLSVRPGLGLYVPRGPLKGIRVDVEAGVPLAQSLDGPQLEKDWNVGLAMTWTR